MSSFSAECLCFEPTGFEVTMERLHLNCKWCRNISFRLWQWWVSLLCGLVGFGVMFLFIPIWSGLKDSSLILLKLVDVCPIKPYHFIFKLKGFPNSSKRLVMMVRLLECGFVWDPSKLSQLFFLVQREGLHRNLNYSGSSIM